MKLLLVSPFTSQSGSAIRFWNIALRLRDGGYTVVYIDRGSRTGRPLFKKEGIVYRTGPTVSPLALDILLSTLFNLFMLLRHADCGLFYALKPAPNNCIPALFARLAGKKTMLDIDDLDYEYLPPGLKKTASRVFFRFFPRFFPLITCHTPRLLAYCRENLRIPDHRLYFLAQGVSQEFLRINILEHPSMKKSILYVATLGITSDFDDCIPLLDRVCAAHPDATVTVVGDGVRRPLFEDSVKNRGLSRSVTFIGQVEHGKLPEIMAAHYVGINYLRPGLVNDCRAILKLREYLACGLSVVCNECGDAELFKEVAFVEKDIADMEKRLVELLHRPGDKNVAGRAFIERHFSWKTIIDDFTVTLVEKKVLSWRENH
ncbi:MAG: glycosyltransferase [Chitinispirillaceae bacterium]|nr:glycosyltransferase [Chitinispirillaceae bacterium]